jgi:hypothetical protein
MKIETIDAVIQPRVLQPSHRMDPRLIRRTILAIMLAGCLLVALRWALNVTNSNARKLSNNLTNLKDGFEKPPLDNQGTPKDLHSTGGPILEPVDSH